MRLENLLDRLPKRDWAKNITNRVREGEIWQHSAFVTYYVLLTTFPLIVGIINWLQQLQLELTGLGLVRLSYSPPAISGTDCEGHDSDL